MLNSELYCSVNCNARCRSITYLTVVWWACAIASTRPFGHSVPQRICASKTDASSFDKRVVFRDIRLTVRFRASTQSLIGTELEQ